MNNIDNLVQSKKESLNRLETLKQKYESYLIFLIDHFEKKVKDNLKFANKEIDSDKIKDLIDIYNDQGNSRTELELKVEDELFKIEIDLLFNNVNNIYICEVTIKKDSECINSKLKYNIKNNYISDKVTLHYQVNDILKIINEHYNNQYNQNNNYNNPSNYNIDISALFDIMDNIHKNKFSELESKNSASPQKFQYLIEKLEEGHFIKPASDEPNVFQLTFKGHEHLKMWNHLWIRSAIENQYNCNLNDLNMTVFMSLAIELYKSKKDKRD